MMLTTSVAAAIRSDSFSKSVTHITPTKGGNRHSPVAGFIIAHRFVMGKHKTEQICVCSVFVCDGRNQKVYVPPRMKWRLGMAYAPMDTQSDGVTPMDS